ncbi:hypothetical protein H0H92_008499, partial [Tricholoma furcatifolium]
MPDTSPRPPTIPNTSTRSPRPAACQLTAPPRRQPPAMSAGAPVPLPALPLPPSPQPPPIPPPAPTIPPEIIRHVVSRRPHGSAGRATAAMPPPPPPSHYTPQRPRGGRA